MDAPTPLGNGAAPKVTVDLNIGQILKDLIELDLSEAPKNKAQTAQGNGTTPQTPLPVNDSSIKKFIELVDKIQAGITYQTESVKRAQGLAVRFMAGIPEPESLKEFDDPVESIEYAKANIEDIDTIFVHVSDGLSRMEKIREGLPRLKGNLDPMQVVTKVAPEQFKKLNEDIVTLIANTEILNTDLTAVITRLISCKNLLNDRIKALSVPSGDVDDKATEENGKINGPENEKTNGPVEAEPASTVDNNAEAAPAEVKEPTTVNGDNI